MYIFPNVHAYLETSKFYNTTYLQVYYIFHL